MKLTPTTVREKYRKGVTKLKKFLYKTDAPVFNVHKKNYAKYALISYLTAPFKTGISYKHNNTQYVLEMARTLDELGYVVDVINFMDDKTYSFEKYDVILGFGQPFTNSYKTNHKAKRIFYGTGMNPAQANIETIKRLQEFHKRHGLWLPESGRIAELAGGLQVQALEGMLYYGNKVIADSFRQTFDGPMFRLHNINFKFRTTEEVIATKKNWKNAKKTFITIIGAGMIHKGLDITLELFAKHPEWELHIGAPILNERRFFDFYEKTLKLPNIHHYGFLDVNSPLYLKLLDKCGFYLSPTASEGCPTTVINACTNGKLIPIANKESGLDDNAEYVVPLKEMSIDELEKSILTAQKLSDKETERLSIMAHRHFSTAHDIENYRKELKSALSDILRDGM